MINYLNCYLNHLYLNPFNYYYYSIMIINKMNYHNITTFIKILDFHCLFIIMKYFEFQIYQKICFYLDFPKETFFIILIFIIKIVFLIQNFATTISNNYF